ncbi:MAG: nitroreductase family protein [Bacteroidales bacterium]|nr:nitroreductase family protein [Bacteroidales bacterium]
MNDTLQTLYNHVSVRNYTDQKISKEVLDQILAAACSGSTMGNMQLFSIIVTEDDEMKKKMAPLHFNQPMATQAPVILTFCADFNRFNRFCEFRDADTEAYSNMQSYHWAVIDALIAAQNACVAAESLGLGFCWLGTITYNVDKFIEVLNLPKHVIPVACIPMGYPQVKPEKTLKLPVEAMIHRETYHDYDKVAIGKLYAEKECCEETKQILEENNLDNLAKVFTQCRYTKKDNEAFAKVLMDALRKQGFLSDL